MKNYTIFNKQWISSFTTYSVRIPYVVVGFPFSSFNHTTILFRILKHRILLPIQPEKSQSLQILTVYKMTKETVFRKTFHYLPLPCPKDVLQIKPSTLQVIELVPKLYTGCLEFRCNNKYTFYLHFCSPSMKKLRS